MKTQITARTIQTLKRGLLAAALFAIAVMPALAANLAHSTGENLGSNGQIDPNYRLVFSPLGPATTMARTVPQYPGWTAPPVNTQWINPWGYGQLGSPGGDYKYETKVDLTGLDPNRVRLNGYWAVDNSAYILVNGAPAIGTGTIIPGPRGFIRLVPFTITGGFISGINKIDFVVHNLPDGIVTGLLVNFFDGDWRQFRSDAIHEGTNAFDTQITTGNAGGMKVKWSNTTDVSGDSSPAIVRNYALANASYSLYVGSYGGVFAFNPDCGGPSCSPVWSKNLPGWYSSSPAVDSLVYITQGNLLEARNPTTGVLVWSGTYGGAGFGTLSSSPVFASVDFGSGQTPAVLVGSTDQHIYAYDVNACIATVGVCSPKWISQTWADGRNHYQISSPVVANNMVYIGDFGGDGCIIAYSAANGHIAWGDCQNAGYVYSSPTVVNGIAYFAVNKYDFNGGWTDGYLFARDASNGNFIWDHEFGVPVYSSPAYANGALYVGTNAGNLEGVDAANGASLCTGSTNGNAAIQYSSPAVVNGVVFVGAVDGNLYAFDGSNPSAGSCSSQLLSLPIGNQSPIQSSPAVADGLVFVENPDGLFAVTP